MRLGGEVQNATRRHDFKGPQNAVQEANWIQAAQKVVDRYLYWEDQAQTFTYLDIWTEFPNKSFWDRNNKAFFRFWADAFTALKAAHPELKIGGPGFVAAQAVKLVEGEKTTAEEFLTYLYQRNIRPDWIGWHLFQNDQQIYNHQRGAAIRTASWIAMQYSDVTRAYLYRAADPRSTPDDGLEKIERYNYTGLFYGDAEATYKPAAHAFRLWAQVVGRFPMLLTTSHAPAEDGLWALAARNDEGEIAVLLSNIAAQDITWNLTFDNAVMEDCQVEIYQVDDAHNGRTAAIWAGGAVTIPAESVQLVILTPNEELQ